MSAFSDFYTILKDLVALSKKAKNQELLALAMDLQEKYFSLKEENEELVNQIKELKCQIERLEEANVMEDNIEYSNRGFFTLKTDKTKIPYCSMCWKKEHKLIPISQFQSWYQYKCGNCKNTIIVMDSKGQPIK